MKCVSGGISPAGRAQTTKEMTVSSGIATCITKESKRKMSGLSGMNGRNERSITIAITHSLTAAHSRRKKSGVSALSRLRSVTAKTTPDSRVV